MITAVAEKVMELLLWLDALREMNVFRKRVVTRVIKQHQPYLHVCNQKLRSSRGIPVRATASVVREIGEGEVWNGVGGKRRGGLFGLF